MKNQGRISIFSQEGWKNFDASGGAQICKPKCARGMKRHSSGVKHFLKGIKKNLVVNPPTPRKSAHVKN